MVAVQFFGVSCDASGGKKSDGLCPRQGVIAGCLLSNNPAQKVIDWYYPTKGDGTPADYTTRDAVEQQCKGDGTVVDP